jgi:hypothetical protein
MTQTGFWEVGDSHSGGGREREKEYVYLWDTKKQKLVLLTSFALIQKH